MKGAIIQDTGSVSATPARATAVGTNPRHSGQQSCHFDTGNYRAAREGRKQRTLHRITEKIAIPDTFPSEGVIKR